MKGRSFLIRFADDFVIGFELEEDARRVMEVLPKRFDRFGLKIHPDKTKLVPFGKPSFDEKTAKEDGTFDFLGFTHFWGKSRKGYWIIKRKTKGKRLSRFVKGVWQWCRDNRHEPLKEQYKMLCAKLRGHYQYYGICGNYSALQTVLKEVERAWKYWLSRRCQKGFINWEKFASSIKDKIPLPKPRIIHII